MFRSRGETQHFGLKPLILAARKKRQCARAGINQIFQPFLVCFRKISEHIGHHFRLIARMPDAEPNAAELISEMADQRFDPIIA